MEAKKILLIEDDEVLRENTQEILELARYEVFTAENGKEGVAKAHEVLPDLIICDIMMPVLDGYGVIHLLNKDPHTSGIPFIFLSAKSEKSDVRKGMALGADDYLTKPFEETDLLAAIEGRLKRSEILRQDYDTSIEGLDLFIENIQEISGLKNLYKDRKPRSFKKKETVYYEGDRAHHLFFLSKGKVRCYKIHEDGKEYTTSSVNEVEFFGHLPIMEDRPYQDFSEAMEESEICRIPRDDFEEILRKDREVGNAFIKLLTNNLYEKERKLLSLAYDTVRKRTADALLELKERFGKEQETDEFGIEISRNDLASMVGTATESVIRTLGDFKEEGLVKVEGKRIHILDESGLKSIW